MKYVVLARGKEDDMIYDSFGVFRKKRNANARLEDIKIDNDLYYVVEKVDPLGSYANDRCEDE